MSFVNDKRIIHAWLWILTIFIILFVMIEQSVRIERNCEIKENEQNFRSDMNPVIEGIFNIDSIRHKEFNQFKEEFKNHRHRYSDGRVIYP